LSLEREQLAILELAVAVFFRLETVVKVEL